MTLRQKYLSKIFTAESHSRIMVTWLLPTAKSLVFSSGSGWHTHSLPIRHVERQLYKKKNTVLTWHGVAHCLQVAKARNLPAKSSINPYVKVIWGVKPNGNYDHVDKTEAISRWEDTQPPSLLLRCRCDMVNEMTKWNFMRSIYIHHQIQGWGYGKTSVPVVWAYEKEPWTCWHPSDEASQW